MALAFAHEVACVRDIGGLSEQDVARATGAGRSTVGAWLRGTRTRPGNGPNALPNYRLWSSDWPGLWTASTSACGSPSLFAPSATTSPSTCSHAVITGV